MSAHDQAIALFEREADSTSAAPALRQYAQRNLPILRRHLAAAQDLMKRFDHQAAG